MPAAANSSALLPPLKWAGGKRWQLPRLAALWSPHAHRRLVEPFCGGLAVALGLRPDRALLNDANPHLVNFYQWVQRGLAIDMPMQNDRAMFYRYRRRFNSLLDAQAESGQEAAALFYYLNRTGYNGLCRFNRRGHFNVPFGRYASITYIRDFRRYGDLLRRWRFTATDIDRVELHPDDFVYADPPYDVEFTQYAAQVFRWPDQVRTAERLSRHPGPVILVNQATPRIKALYRDLGYHTSFVDAPRRISCTGDRRAAREIMATKNLGR